MTVEIVQTRPLEEPRPPPVRGQVSDTRSGANEVAVGERPGAADPRAAAAASALAQAVQRLRTIRRKALGGNYDQATFDKAVRMCRLVEADVRTARQECDAARAAAGERSAGRTGGATPSPPDEVGAQDVAARHLGGASRFEVALFRTAVWEYQLAETVTEAVALQAVWAGGDWRAVVRARYPLEWGIAQRLTAQAA
jgi:hypothetical protein